MAATIVIHRDNIIKEGFLEKQSKFIRQWRKRNFVLTNQYLCSFAKEGEYENPTEYILLHECTTVKSCDDETGKENSFRIDTLSRSFYLVADSSAEKDSWISQISRQLLRPDVLTKAVQAALASGATDGATVTFNNIQALSDLTNSKPKPEGSADISDQQKADATPLADTAEPSAATEPAGGTEAPTAITPRLASLEERSNDQNTPGDTAAPDDANPLMEAMKECGAVANGTPPATEEAADGAAATEAATKW